MCVHRLHGMGIALQSGECLYRHVDVARSIGEGEVQGVKDSPRGRRGRSGGGATSSGVGLATDSWIKTAATSKSNILNLSFMSGPVCTGLDYCNFLKHGTRLLMNSTVFYTQCAHKQLPVILFCALTISSKIEQGGFMLKKIN
jgi:hypothetical protein